MFFHNFFMYYEKNMKESFKLSKAGLKYRSGGFSVSTAQRSWITGLYWTGIAMAAASLAVVLAGNTELVSRFEYAGFPLSWVFAGVSIFALVAFEFCDRTFSTSERQDRSYHPSPRWETAERLDLIRLDTAEVTLSATDSASV